MQAGQEVVGAQSCWVVWGAEAEPQAHARVVVVVVVLQEMLEEAELQEPEVRPVEEVSKGEQEVEMAVSPLARHVPYAWEQGEEVVSSWARTSVRLVRSL